jgi:hypothetical protein
MKALSYYDPTGRGGDLKPFKIVLFKRPKTSFFKKLGKTPIRKMAKRGIIQDALKALS